MKRKPLQIAIAGECTEASTERLVVLCDDGTIWFTSLYDQHPEDAEWLRFSDIPQTGIKP